MGVNFSSEFFKNKNAKTANSKVNLKIKDRIASKLNKDDNNHKLQRTKNHVMDKQTKWDIEKMFSSHNNVKKRENMLKLQENQIP